MTSIGIGLWSSLILLCLGSFAAAGQSLPLCVEFSSPSLRDSLRIRVIYQNILLYDQTQLLTARSPCVLLPSRPRGLHRVLVETSCCGVVEKAWNADTLRATSRLTLQLRERVIQLPEAIVKPVQRFKVQGDTLLIEVADVATRPHADATALFEKIPGLSIGIGGQVSVLGQGVQEVTVDGKKLFGGIARLSLTAIRSDMIEHMEFIKKDLGNGQTRTTLNLVLKEDRKRGYYGDLAGGYGTQGRYLGSLRLNKITPSGFLNGFAQSNSINQPLTFSQQDERTLMLSMLNALNGPSSVIGLFDAENLLTTPDPPSPLAGINYLHSSGLNYSHSSERATYQASLLWSNQSQLKITQIQQQTYVGTTTQNQTILETESLESRQLSAYLEGKVNLNPRNSVRWSYRLSKKPTSTGRSLDAIVSLSEAPMRRDSTNFRKEQSAQEWQTDSQLAWSRIGAKKGTNTSVFGRFAYTHASEYGKWNTTQRRLPTASYRWMTDAPTTLYTIQAVQSFPLSKRFLLEGSLKMSNREDDFSKTTYRTSPFSASEAVSASQSGTFTITQPYQEVSLFGLYQRSRWSLVGGLSGWHWHTSRGSDSLFQTQRKQVWVPFVKLRLRALGSSSIALVARQKFSVPELTQLIPLSDSSQAWGFSVGNLSLLPYTSHSLGIEHSLSLMKKIHVNYALSYQQYARYPVSNTQIDPTGFVINRLMNSSLPVAAIDFTFSAFRLSLSTKDSWVCFGSYHSQKSFIVNESAYIPISTAFFLLNQAFKWSYPTTAFQADWQLQGSRLGSSWNMLNSIHLKNESELGQGWYLNPALRFQVTSLTRSTWLAQPFLDVELTKYFFKNNSAAVSLITQNLFNVRQERRVAQLDNAQTDQRTNYLPRLGLIKLTVYPESW